MGRIALPISCVTVVRTCKVVHTYHICLVPSLFLQLYLCILLESIFIMTTIMGKYVLVLKLLIDA